MTTKTTTKPEPATAPAESARVTEDNAGSAEPFCACGRRVSHCDHSRRGCSTNRR
jgi:hypothetical protein